ncbi:MAG: sel1 repeat family protein [Pseudomonadota bacterium]
MRCSLQLGFAVLLTGTALAQAPETVEDDFGILNPPDTGREMLVRKIEMGGIDSVSCSLAFNNTKYDNLPLARKLATRCAEAGITKAMTWMSYLENNGLGGEANPEAAAEWDRRAAEAGDPIGLYNYGLDLIRGHGVARDEILGRSYVDRAASEGLEVARQLQAADYDLDVVTPDADEWQ